MTSPCCKIRQGHSPIALRDPDVVYIRSSSLFVLAIGAFSPQHRALRTEKSVLIYRSSDYSSLKMTSPCWKIRQGHSPIALRDPDVVYIRSSSLFVLAIGAFSPQHRALRTEKSVLIYRSSDYSSLKMTSPCWKIRQGHSPIALRDPDVSYIRS